MNIRNLRTPSGDDYLLLPERDLVALAREGDDSAFELLYDRHKRRIMALCLRMVNNHAEAEELVQDTFVQAFRKLETFRGDSAFSTWLHRIAVNIVLMKVRKHRISEVLIINQQSNEDEIATTELGTEDLWLRGAVERVDLEAAVAELAPGYRLVFLLHDVEGYDHGEIAELLHCSAGCSKSQLHKARLKLRRKLQRRSSTQIRAAECEFAA